MPYPATAGFLFIVPLSDFWPARQLTCRTLDLPSFWPYIRPTVFTPVAGWLKHNAWMKGWTNGYLIYIQAMRELHSSHTNLFTYKSIVTRLLTVAQSIKYYSYNLKTQLSANQPYTSAGPSAYFRVRPPTNQRVWILKHPPWIFKGPIRVWCVFNHSWPHTTVII